jgi:hypothetical protein
LAETVARGAAIRFDTANRGPHTRAYGEFDIQPRAFQQLLTRNLIFAESHTMGRDAAIVILNHKPGLFRLLCAGHIPTQQDRE